MKYNKYKVQVQVKGDKLLELQEVSHLAKVTNDSQTFIKKL